MYILYHMLSFSALNRWFNFLCCSPGTKSDLPALRFLFQADHLEIVRRQKTGLLFSQRTILMFPNEAVCLAHDRVVQQVSDKPSIAVIFFPACIGADGKAFFSGSLESSPNAPISASEVLTV